MFAAWGRTVYQFRWLVLIASVLSLVAAIFSVGYGGRLGTGGFSSQTESGRANELVDEALSEKPPSLTLIFGSDDLEGEDPALRSGVERALGPLRDDSWVALIRTPYDDLTSPTGGMFSRDRKRAFAVVELKYADRAELQKAYADLRKEVRSGSLEVPATGNLP